MNNATIEIEILGREVEVDVEYSVFGCYRQQTMVDPAEYPELEISKVTRVVNGSEVDISDMFTSEEYENITELLEEEFYEDEY